MALVVTFDAQPGGRSTMFPRKVRRGSIALGTYAAGGIAITPKNLEMIRIDDLDIQPTTGYTFEYLPSTGKVKAYTTVQTYTAVYDPASLAATTARDDAVTVTGVAATDVCLGYQAAPALTSGLDIQEVRVSGANTITVRLNNASAGAIDGASGTWTFYVAKANGALNEVAAAVDLSGFSARFRAEGA